MEVTLNGTYSDLQRLDAFRVQSTSGKTKVGQLDVASRVDKEVPESSSDWRTDNGWRRAHLWLEITVDVT